MIYIDGIIKHLLQKHHSKTMKHITEGVLVNKYDVSGN